MLKETLQGALPTMSIEELLPGGLDRAMATKVHSSLEPRKWQIIFVILASIAMKMHCSTITGDESDFWTRNDFVDLCEGDELKAEMVFGMCSWESPGCILDLSGTKTTKRH